MRILLLVVVGLRNGVLLGLAVACLVVVGGCGGDDAAQTVRGPPVAPPEPAPPALAPAAEPAPAPRPEPVPSSEPAPAEPIEEPESSPPEPPLAVEPPAVERPVEPSRAAPTGFRVVGLAEDAALEVRVEPQRRSELVGTFAADATDVQTTGFATIGVPSAGWWEVRLDEGTSGWVRSEFLALPPEWTAPLTELPCASGDFGQSDEVGGDPGSEASHVFALSYEQGADCDRFVIVFGAGQVFPEQGATSSLAASVPAGIVVTGGEAAIQARLPAAEPAGSEIPRPTARELAADGATAFVVRNQELGLDVRVHFAVNQTFTAFALSEPARLVIDLKEAPTDPVLELATVVSSTVVLPQPLNRDPGAEVVLPLVVSGYATVFEATGHVELRTAADMPGRGDPVEATFDGTDFLGAVRDWRYAFSANDSIGAWGEFSFTIDELAAGEYDLFIGMLPMEPGLERRGLFHRFTVGPTVPA